MKPDRVDLYGDELTALCERTVVTLLRGCGPWKNSLYLAGGLVPRYLPKDPESESRHVGTQDVDLLVDLAALQDLEAYRTLEQNLKDLGFERDHNLEGRARHFAWRRQVAPGRSVVVDLLCTDEIGTPGRAVSLPGERRLSALPLPGGHLVLEDYLEVSVTADLLDGGGTATETVRVANRVPFLVLKALAYDDRFARKDAYDLVWCLLNAQGGPAAVGRDFAAARRLHPDDPLLPRTLDILRRRFLSNEGLPAIRKDGPTSYALFLSSGEAPAPELLEQAATAVAIFVAQAGH